MRFLLRTLATKILYVLLHDWITRHTQHLFALQNELQLNRQEIQRLRVILAEQEKNLNTTESKLALINNELIIATKKLEKFRIQDNLEETSEVNQSPSEVLAPLKEEWRRYVSFTIAMFILPLVLFYPDFLLDKSQCSSSLDLVSSNIDCSVPLRSTNIIALAGMGLICAMAYIINLVAPFPNDNMGSAKERIKIITERIPRWQFYIAFMTGLSFSLGAYNVSNFTNLAGLCIALSLSTLPTVMNRPRL